jgi:hypothetical protein
MAVVNDIKTHDLISKEAGFMLDVVADSIGLVNRQYDKRYDVAGAEQGADIRIKKAMEYEALDTPTYSETNFVEREVTLDQSKWTQVPVDFTAQNISQDLSDPSNMNKFAGEELTPAINKVLGDMSSRFWNERFLEIPNVSGSPGTTPNSYTFVTDAAAILDEHHAPQENRCFTVSPRAYAAMNAGQLVGSNKVQDSVKTQGDYNLGTLQNQYNVDINKNVFVGRHTQGTQTTADFAVNGTITDGAVSIPVDGLSAATATITRGSVIQIDGVYEVDPVSKSKLQVLKSFVVTEDATGVASEIATLKISPAIEADGPYQNVDALPVDDAAVRIISGDPSKTYEQHVLFQRDAMAIATTKIADIGASMYEKNIMSETGNFNIKYTVDGDGRTMKRINRFDALWGGTVIHDQWAVRVIGSGV